MYGFLAYVIATVIMVFWYPTPATPDAPPSCPSCGSSGPCWSAPAVTGSGSSSVSAEGHTPFRLMRADLFIVSLLASATLGLIWAGLQAMESPWTNVFLGLYLIASTVLFGSVPWSKFSHMFYKPAAALEKRVSEATGSRKNLPAPADKPETFGSAPRRPRHY